MKKVVGFENWYSVTDDGHIFSHHRDVWLKPSKVGAGYHRVGLYYLGKTHNRYVHRIVAEAFIGPSNGREINHKNGEKTDNRVENLEWVTRSQNNQHKHYELGHAIKPVTATCLTTGNIRLYASVEKTKIDGFEPKHVSAICLGKRKMHKGYTFEFTPSPPAQQEPVAWYRDEDGIRIYYESKVWDDATPLYTSPAQRTWVGLTDEERFAIADEYQSSAAAALMVEAKLKEKNT